jgi:hypothetical protein
MRTRKEYNHKKERSAVFENPPKIKFNYNAVIDCERDILYVMQGVPPMSSYLINSKLTNKVISYTTIRRYLEDLFFIGWIGKRRVRSRTFYYLTKETEKELKRRI